MLSTYARIVNNFLHDMATGTWAACLLVLVVLRGRAAGADPEVVAALGAAGAAVFRLAVGAVATVAVTGGIRLGYWRREARPEELVAKRRALVLKHVAFLLVYGPGTVWAWTLVAGR